MEQRHRLIIRVQLRQTLAPVNPSLPTAKARSYKLGSLSAFGSDGKSDSFSF